MAKAELTTQAPEPTIEAAAQALRTSQRGDAPLNLPVMENVTPVPATEPGFLRRVLRTKTAKVGFTLGAAVPALVACAKASDQTPAGNQTTTAPNTVTVNGKEYILIDVDHSGNVTPGDKLFDPTTNTSITIPGGDGGTSSSATNETNPQGQTQDSFATAVEGIIGNVGLQVTDVNHNGLIDAGDTFKDATGHTVTITESQVSEAKQLIANTLGVGDRAKQGSSWEILNEGTQHLAVHLIDGDVVTRVNTDGMIVEGYFKIDKPGNPSLSFVVNGKSVPQMDLIGGTFRTDAPDVTLSHLWAQHLNAEANNPLQAGTLSIPIGFRPESCGTQGMEVPIRSKADAAAFFGTDDYSHNPANWTVTEYNDSVAYAMTPDSSGLTHRLHNLQGTFYEGYIDVADDGAYPFFDKGVRAISFVGNGSVVSEEDSRGTTIYAPKGYTSPSQLNDRTFHLWNQHNDVENKPASQGGQPGQITLPYGFDPQNPSAC